MTHERYTITLDDDPVVRRIIEAATGLRSLSFTSANAFIRRAARYAPCAVFVDVNLGEGATGLELIPKMREWWPFTPILVVTATPDDNAVAVALASGANDFLRKPLRPPEFLARLAARTNEMAERARRQTLSIGDVRLDIVYRLLTGPTGTCYLTELDARLLSILGSAAQAVVPRTELKGTLWGAIKVSNNALDKRLSALRQALRDVGSELSLTSAYGQGVSLNHKPKSQGAA